MADFIAAKPHGEIQEIFPDTFFVTGTTTPNFQGTQFQFSRNMTIIRDGDALTLVNTVRLDDAGLARLDSLGTVKNVVKLGAFHGYDDPFYLDRYGAKQWALPGMTHEGGQPTDVELIGSGPMPFLDGSLFVFETAKKPEGLLLRGREGGILISCDSLQNWAEVDEYFSESSAKMMTEFGFIKPANIGPGWRRSAEPKAEDFKRLEALSFRHLLPAHGKPLRDEAHEKISATIAAAFEA